MYVCTYVSMHVRIYVLFALGFLDELGVAIVFKQLSPKTMICYRELTTTPGTTYTFFS